MSISLDTRVGEVVKLNFKTAPLFQSNHIDYCCGGNRTLLQACQEAGVEPEQLIAQLEEITGSSDPDSEYIMSLSLDEFCGYIVRRQHSSVRKNIPFLTASLEKLCDVHGANHPELFGMRQLFGASAGDLTMHMQKEELMLFPYIQKMARAKKEGTGVTPAMFGPVTNPIGAMIAEHETEGGRFDRMATISGNYRIPSDACTTYRTTLQVLQEFENDLHRHIHLENNILFPKAIELEAALSV